MSRMCRNEERCYYFFFNDTATTEIYTLSLHDALPIFAPPEAPHFCPTSGGADRPAEAEPEEKSSAASLPMPQPPFSFFLPRSEEHTSELQSRQYLVCRLLLEKKNIIDL